MAGLLLAGAGAAIGGAIGGSFLGISSAVIGQAIGAVVGSQIDNYLFAPTLKFTQEGPRLEEMQVFTSGEGRPILRGYGRFRVSGNMIWATRFREEVVKDTETSGGKGGGPKQKTTTITYNYYANFAVGICEGTIQNINRMWADGQLVDLSELTYRVYKGTEDQTPDSLIITKEGSGNAPAYKGLAYIVFEDMLINRFGNRIPQLSFEITKPVKRSDGLSVGELINGIDLIPGTTEFGYDPDVVDQVIYGGDSGTDIVEKRVENNHVISTISNWELALDQMQDNLPNCNIVVFVVTWFGEDLRIGECKIKPKVENRTKRTSPYEWTVAGLQRNVLVIEDLSRGEQETLATELGVTNPNLLTDEELLAEFDNYTDDEIQTAQLSLDWIAGLMTQVNNRPAFGGSPADISVYKAILDLKARGYEVMIYPFILLDIETNNTLPNPYSDNAADSGQSVYPWRGRITVSPAAEYAGTVDKTSAAGTQVANFLGSAEASDFSGSAGTVSFSGGNDWGFKRFVLHLAELARQAGGVEYFCIGTEMVRATTARSDASTFPFVDGLIDLAGEVSTLLPSAQIGYAADWSEYHSYRPGDGSGDVYFHLDPLWNDNNIDFIGIDNYLPMSDWRDGINHLDYGDGVDEYGNPKGKSIYEEAYLKGQIEGGEYYDYFYASDADRASQTRTPITDGQHGEPWIFRNKDINSWWSNPHHHRREKLRDDLTDIGHEPASWVLVAGATRVASGESAIFGFDTPQEIRSGGSTGSRARVHTGTIDNTGGKRFVYRTWVKQGTSDSLYLVVEHAGGAPQLRYTFSTDTIVEVSSGHVINEATLTDIGGGIFECVFDVTLLASDSTVIFSIGPFTGTSGQSVICYGAEVQEFGVSTTGWVPKSKPIIMTEYGCPALNKGTNQPNVFFDPKSSESFVPYFSSGGRDDEIQRQYIKSFVEYWTDNDNNPASDVYSGRMIDSDRLCYWSYDARPWPTFPNDGDIWADQPNWQYGHWISGRIDTVYIPDLLKALAEDYELTANYDFTHAYGTCDGFVVQSKTSFRSTVEPLSTVYMFDIIESGDSFKAVSEQENYSVATLTMEDIAQTEDDEVVTFSRRQETELPKALSIRYSDVFSEYEIASVGNSRETVEATSDPVTDTPIVIDMARAQQLVDRMLYSAWAKKTMSEFGMLPQYLYLEAGDVVTLDVWDFDTKVRIESIADAAYRKVAARSFDQGIFDGGGSEGRTQPINVQPVSSSVIIAFMDLPMLRSVDQPFQPYVGSYINPWPQVNVFKSTTSSNYLLDSTISGPATIGETLTELTPGTPNTWDETQTLGVEIYSGILSSLSKEDVLNGSNALAIENSSGGWEIIQFANAQLDSERRYTLSTLLRGQLGTEDNMQGSFPAGSRVVLLDNSLQQLEFNVNDIGREYHLKYGPADRDIGDDTYLTTQKTFNGRGLKPFSPVHVKAVDSSGDWVISWIRRDRIGSDGWDYTTDIPMSEATESYEVDIMANVGSSTVVRTLTVTGSPTVTYTAAQQSADSVTGPTDIMVYQISDIVGRGIGRRATINP